METFILFLFMGYQNSVSINKQKILNRKGCQTKRLISIIIQEYYKWRNCFYGMEK